MRDAIEEIERRRLAPFGDKDLGEIHNIILRRMQLLPQVVTTTVIDADGWNRRASTSNYPLSPLDVRDREYFRSFSNEPRYWPIYIAPIKSRAAVGKWAIPLARRVNNF